MDSLRGSFDRGANDDADSYNDGYFDDEVTREAPPSPIGQDERRMQVRAYNHWASLLDNRNFPAVEDLDAEALPDFGPFSVLLDFTNGIDNPTIQYLGDKLAEECGAHGVIDKLSDVPSRSLLSRITDHYMQILANQAPIGFEAEFVNQRESTILYRGILLPFSSDDDTIDFIYGVINWKELADQRTTDELMLEIDQALDAVPAPRSEAMPVQPMDEWVEPVADMGSDALFADDDDSGILDLGAMAHDESHETDLDWPEPAFGLTLAPIEPLFVEPSADVPASVPLNEASTDMELADWLASARELARAAQGSEDRTRHALYAAIGRAYDFSLAAAAAPADFAELIADSGLTVQDRAPMTPVVKLVFGADYDKTRLTEFASALNHAQRLGLGHGALTDFLASAPGGLKGVVSTERQLRKDASGKPAATRDGPREALARKLRKIEPIDFEDIAEEGSEFALVLIRRLPSGELVLIGEVPDDVALVEKAARALLGA